MKIVVEGPTVLVTGLKELGAAHAKHLRDECSRAFGEDQKFIQIDLSETIAIDSIGLGALFFLHKTASRRKGLVRLVRPRPPVQQLLELTRLHRLLEIVPEGRETFLEE